MIWDAYDIVDAWYWFCLDYHNGDNCILYKRYMRISQWYKPARRACAPATSNACAIYADITQRYDNKSLKVRGTHVPCL